MQQVQAVIRRLAAVLILLPILSLAAPAMPEKENLLKVTCVKVVDGDTAWFEEASGLVVHKVRFIGIDTPETVHPAKPVQYFGPEASAFTAESLLNKQAWLEYDVEPHDHYDRHLCYVWLDDGNLFNLTLIDQGFAVLDTWPPNVKYVDFFTAAQEIAREQEKGLWAGD